jgi:topoisomerase-4 subunit B
VLLLTLFFRHFRQLVDRGHIHVARPPLLGRCCGAGQACAPLYCLDDDELEELLNLAEKVKDGSWEISRFKGLGEMSPEQLWETTMNPDTRLLRVGLGELPPNTASTLTMLMGRAESRGAPGWKTATKPRPTSRSLHATDGARV